MSVFASQVYKTEWSFGATTTRRHPGIRSNVPEQDARHVFDYRLFLGVTDLKPEDVTLLIGALMEEERWQGDRYNFLANNCQHFACELASQLHVSPLPPEIHRVTRAAQAVACNDGWSPTTRGTTAYATPSPRSQFSELTFLQSLPIHQLIRLLFLLVLMAVAFGVWWVVAALNVPNVPAEAAEAAEVRFQIDFGAARCENGPLPTIPCQCAEQDEDESEEG